MSWSRSGSFLGCLGRLGPEMRAGPWSPLLPIAFGEANFDKLTRSHRSANVEQLARVVGIDARSTQLTLYCDAQLHVAERT